jgi:diadenosine tetraphosphate (Ap4A) HIT family hydrolase
MCVFCNLPDSVKLMNNEQFFVIKDKHPDSPGHCLVVSNRHVQTFFDLSEEEAAALRDICLKAKVWLDEKYQPTGYNLLINHGASAGQSVFHFHLHLIPRYG